MSNEERPYEPDWIIEHITSNGHKSSFYPLWIEGHHLDTGETFYWNVPDIESWRHVLTPQAQEELAAIVEQARPARVDFWHPALPEVVDTSNGRVMIARPFPRDGRFFARAVQIATFVLFLLPFTATAQPTAPAPCKINLQTATPAQLALLPGIGEKTAALIAEAKPANLDELDAVKGIGTVKLAAIEPYAAFGDAATTCTEKLRLPGKPAAVKPEAAGGGR